MHDFEIKRLNYSPEICDQLAEILVEVVANNGSVTFLHPLPLQQARTFWENSFRAAERQERIILAACDKEKLLGTVTLQLDCAPNQPHRGEIAKMMTHPICRGRGIAKALLLEAERLAREHQKTLLVLDTAADGGASGLYEKVGYIFAGSIPDFALKPLGGYTATRIYWKKII
jgi:ribosomal protein S18 acetylase RimI-like enzyme